VIKESEIPSAGLGLFAAEHIEKGRLIGVMEGEIEPNPEETDLDCFEIANGGCGLRTSFANVPR
jgi:SET domain-containing protein